MQASGRSYAQHVPRSIMPKQQRATFAKALSFDIAASSRGHGEQDGQDSNLA